MDIDENLDDMSVLNSEVLREILMYLDIESLRNFSLSSSRCFYRAKKFGCWKLVISAGKMCEERINVLFGRQFDVISVNGNIGRDFFKDLLITNRATLKHVTINDMLLRPETFLVLGSLLLRSLSLANCTLSAPIPDKQLNSLKMSRLKKLTLLNEKRINSSHKIVGNHFVGATNLEILNVAALEAESCMKLMGMATKLRELSMTIWNGRTIMICLTTPSLLETISLNGIRVVNVIQMLRSQSEMKQLSILNCGIQEIPGNDATLVEFSQLISTDSIRDLNVETSGHRVWKILNRENHNLEKLRITRCFLDSIDICTLAMKFPNLVKLEIHGNLSTDCVGFSAFSKLCQIRLDHILPFCNYEDDIDRIRDELPEIQIL